MRKRKISWPLCNVWALIPPSTAALPESHDSDKDPADEPAIQFDDSVDVTPMQ